MCCNCRIGLPIAHWHCATHRRVQGERVSVSPGRGVRSCFTYIPRIHSFTHVESVSQHGPPRAGPLVHLYTHPKCAHPALRDVTHAPQDGTLMPPPGTLMPTHMKLNNKYPAIPLIRRVPAQFSSLTNHRPQTAACNGLTPGSRSHLAPFHIQGHHRPPAEWQVGLALRAALRLESTSIESSVDLSSSARPTWT